MYRKTGDPVSNAPFLEQTSNWTPLIDLIGKDHAEAFMLVGNCGDIMIYKHHRTRRFINIQVATGQTYCQNGDQVYLPIDPEVAIASALGLRSAKRGETDYRILLTSELKRKR